MLRLLLLLLEGTHHHLLLLLLLLQFGQPHRNALCSLRCCASARSTRLILIGIASKFLEIHGHAFKRFIDNKHNCLCLQLELRRTVTENLRFSGTKNSSFTPPQSQNCHLSTSLCYFFRSPTSQ